MSREDLTHTYIRGEMSRRRFVNRLMGAGVSFAAAVTYARALAAEPAAGKTSHSGPHDHYDHYDHAGNRPGKGCGDKNHRHDRQDECKKDKKGPPKGPKDKKGPPKGPKDKH